MSCRDIRKDENLTVGMVLRRKDGVFSDYIVTYVGPFSYRLAGVCLYANERGSFVHETTVDDFHFSRLCSDFQVVLDEYDWPINLALPSVP